MAYPIHGKKARSVKNSVPIDFTASWDITVNVTLDEITSQGDNWKKSIVGITEWDGTIECWFDPSNTEQKALMDNIIAAIPGVKLTDLQFSLEDSADYLAGDLFITSMPISANIGSKVTCNFEFTGDDAISLTIA